MSAAESLLAHANESAIFRFWARVSRPSPEDCWEWIGKVGVDGYGRHFLGKHGRRNCLAHRLSYEIANGPVPASLQLDHLCRNRRCVNPAHLEAVTQRENILRSEALNAVTVRTDTCQRNHPFSEIAYTHPKTGKRQCKACRRLRRAAGAA